MRLRELKLDDAPHMLEWMHDETIVADLRGKFTSKTMEDCRSFIRASEDKTDCIHFAIASDSDEYMGTVSLKDINRSNCSAEFAIVVRKAALGRGYSWYGMKEILNRAFEEYGLESVYWCVSRVNKRAVRFYDKHNFHEAVDIPASVRKRYCGACDLKWYSALKGDVFDVRNEAAGCRIVHINTVPTIDAGELSFFEADRDAPFGFKRIYYISKVPEGSRRGFHAHKKLKQLLFCPYGRIQLLLDNGDVREEVELSDPSVGVLIEKPTWREMLWIQKDSVLCVAASDYYDADDYIRDYSEFKKYRGSEETSVQV